MSMRFERPRATCRILFICLAVLAGVSCGTGDSGGIASLSITFSPNPVSRNADGVWKYHAKLSETSGIGVQIQGFTVAGYDNAGAFLGETFYAPGDFETLFNTSNAYLPAGGWRQSDELTVSDSPGHRIWQFTGKDDNGNEINVTARVNLS